jgi:hypothetical protein
LLSGLLLPGIRFVLFKIRNDLFCPAVLADLKDGIQGSPLQPGSSSVGYVAKELIYTA